MKKLVLSLIAITVLGMSSCKKESSVTPQIKNETGKVSTKGDLSSYD